jgi:signal transduction histidine kinase
LEAGYRALKIAEARAETRLMACLLNNIGFLHIAMGQPQEALPFLTRSLASSCEAAICPVQAAALDSLSVAYRELGDFEQSLIYAHECQSFAHNHGLLRSEAEATSNIAQIHARNGDDVQALACFESALVHTRQIEYRPLEVTVLMETGRLHARQRAFEPALQCLQEALALAEQLDAKQQIIDVCEALANVFEQAENYAQALLFRKRYEVTKEAAFNTRSYYRMQSLQVAHEAEHARKEAEIYHLKNVALQTEIQEKQLALVDLDAFASMVAHDLKSPIATIVAYGELIMCDRGSTLSDEASQFLREAVSLGYAVAGMVDDLLTFARLRREEMVFEPLDMAPLIQSVEQRLNPLILERKAVILMPEDWPCALGNRGWVREIWINYISNAIHYGGEPPQVQLGATRQPDGMIRFWVKDNGAGITSERQKRLFSEFTRLRAVGNGGHGLGLSIVKRIVEKLGGEVGVESAGVRGLGSVFSFTLPAA